MLPRQSSTTEALRAESDQPAPVGDGSSKAACGLPVGCGSPAPHRVVLSCSIQIAYASSEASSVFIRVFRSGQYPARRICSWNESLFQGFLKGLLACCRPIPRLVLLQKVRHARHEVSVVFCEIFRYTRRRRPSSGGPRTVLGGSISRIAWSLSSAMVTPLPAMTLNLRNSNLLLESMALMWFGMEATCF